jgi:hypothetical protein
MRPQFRLSRWRRARAPLAIPVRVLFVCGRDRRRSPAAEILLGGLNGCWTSSGFHSFCRDFLVMAFVWSISIEVVA